MLETLLINLFNLSKRESQVLVFVVQGYTNKEISKKLNISVHTVKAHVSSLLSKFNVEDRVSLAVNTVRQCLKNEIEI